MPFSASIVERNFAYVPDRLLKLGGAAWLRTLGGPALTAPWERIRFGALCSVTPFGVNNINDTLFLLGICSGMTNPGSAFSTDNFIGASLIGAETTGASRVLTYTAGAGNPYYTCTVGRGFRKASFTANTATANFSSGLLIPLAGFGTYNDGNTAFYARRAVIIIDITKTPGGAGTVTLAVYFSTTAATVQTVDMRPDHLFEALDQPGTPNIRGQTLTQVLNSTALNISELGGAFDTFEIYWSNSTYPLEISALGASILRPLSYTGASASDNADESAQEYSVTSGSISPTTFLSGGTGWAGAGSISYDFLTAGSFVALSNFAAQVSTDYVGTTFSSDEPFQQYLVGTVDSGTTVYLGSFWTTPMDVATTTGNLTSQETNTLAGTNLGAYDTFVSYATNTSTNGTTDSFNGGTFWAVSGTIYNGSFVYAGTTGPNFAPLTVSTALAGTTYGGPYDTFEQYGTGTVDSGITLNAGSYWYGNGTITVFNYP